MPTKSASKQLTISIISYNTKLLLKRCLKSIYQFTKGISFEVIVVDNASSDGSAQMVAKSFPQVKLIQNQVNRFYTGANNQALRVAQGKLFLILNSDIFLKDNALKKMVDYLTKHPRVAAVEPLQRYEDGRIAPTGSRHNSLWLDITQLTLLHRLIKPKKLADYQMKKFDRTKTWPAEIICDAAMLLPTSLLKKIGGYDEALKLYYTENDLCHRIQKQGLTTVHLGKAVVWHTVSASTQKAGWKKISPIYSQDARIYYRKYHSVFSGWLISLIMKLSNLTIELKNNFWLIGIILLATFLRFYRLPETMTFIGDQGRDYLAARDMVLTGQWPLVGIPSSVPWLRQGPFFIWLAALALKLGSFNPLTPAILTAVLGVVTVYLVYKFSRSRLAALVLATAPLTVIHSRLAYHISPIPLFTILFLTALQQQSVVWSFLLAGILLQFELTTLPLVFFATLFFYRRRQRFYPACLVFLLPFIPKFIYDLTHGFKQTVGLAAWSVHRLWELRPAENLIIVNQTILDYWRKFTTWDNTAAAILLGLLGLIVIWRYRLLRYFLLINLLAFYIHGGPSEAYFPVLFPVWAMMLGLVRSKLVKVGVIILCLINVYKLINHDFFTYGPTLSQRLALIELVPQEAQLVDFAGNPAFTSYLDNYRYLLWWRGVKPLPGSPLFSIYDGPEKDFLPPLGATVYHYSKQKLIKYD